MTEDSALCAGTNHHRRYGMEILDHMMLFRQVISLLAAFTLQDAIRGASARSYSASSIIGC
jgi:hypothetical protein